MQQFGGKDSKRHFTVVMGGKEHGLYISSTPSSAAKKAVTKLCAANKSKKVEFSIREITQGSKKKTYGPYEGYIEKLKEPIELKGRVIKYKPVAKLVTKKGAQKGGEPGKNIQIFPKKYIDIKCMTLGRNNRLVTGEQYAQIAKKTLEEDQFLKGLIDRIVIQKNFLRIYLTEKGCIEANFVRTKAGIFGCNARLIENKYHFYESKRNNTTNENGKPKQGSYIGNFIPPNNNISATFY